MGKMIAAHVQHDKMLMWPARNPPNHAYLHAMDREKLSAAKREAAIAISAWRDYVQKASGLNAKTWAQKASISATTITRGMAPNASTTTKIENLHLLARAANAPSVLDFLGSGRVSAQPPDSITVSLNGLATFLRVALNAEQEDLFSQDETLALARMLRSALDVAGRDPEILGDPKLWETFLRGHVAPRPSDSPES